MRNIFSVFIPKDTDFWILFREFADKMVYAARELQQILYNNDPMLTEKSCQNINVALQEVYNLSHHITKGVHQTFITPIDRQDILKLNQVMYRTIKIISTTAKKIRLYKVDIFSSDYPAMCDTLCKSTMSLKEAISELGGESNIEKMTELLLDVNAMEKQCDELYSKFTKTLFSDLQNDIDIIKHQEISSSLEIATDSCLDVADVIQNILVTNS